MDVSKSFNTVDVGLNLGLGYQLKSGLFFSGGYNLGLSRIDKSYEGYEGSDVKIKNRVIQISLGYKF